MTWFGYGVLTAGSLAICDSLSKILIGETDAISLTCLRLLGAVPPMLLLWWLQPSWHLEPTALLFIALAAPLQVGAVKLYMEAIATSDLSLVTPLLAFTPALLIPLGSLLTAQRLGIDQMAGILLIAAGAYVLNFGEFRGRGPWGPILALGNNHGSRRMLVVAATYGLTASLSKRGLAYADPISYGTIYYGSVAAIAIVVWGRALPLHQPVLRRRWLPIALIALTSAVMVAAHFLSLATADVAPMIAVKRLSLVFSVLIGVTFFGEPHARLRVPASLLMLAGAAWLYLAL